MLTIKQFASIPAGTDLTALYRAAVGDYPKFFKMDTACKLGFLLAEQLADEPRFVPREDRAVLMFSTCGCLCNDLHYEETVKDFPSPALFVYTLPNIITGEIAIRNKYEGETSAYVLERFDPAQFAALVEQSFLDGVTGSALCGWVDARSEGDFTAFAFLVERDGNGLEFSVETYMEQLIEEIKLKLIDALNLDGMTPADIDNDAPLFGDEGLGLDSIDVLELIVLLERNYGIRLANPQEGKKVFQSVAVMADYVAANRTK